MRVFASEKITERITRLILPGNVFAYLVEGEESALLIDTGLGYGDLRGYVEELLKGKPYEVILTHGHLDHAGAAVEFECVWLHSADFQLAVDGNSREARAGYITGNGTRATAEELDEVKDDGYLSLSYGQIFDLGNEILEIVCLGGHTPGSIGVLFKEERILLSGDACCSFTLLFGRGGSLTIKEYRENLIRLWDTYKNDFDTVLYSHPHNYGGPQVITEMIELCTEILEDRDDKIPAGGVGRKGYLAKATDQNSRRTDGKIANLMYVERA